MTRTVSAAIGNTATTVATASGSMPTRDWPGLSSASVSMIDPLPAKAACPPAFCPVNARPAKSRCPGPPGLMLQDKYRLKGQDVEALHRQDLLGQEGAAARL